MSDSASNGTVSLAERAYLEIRDRLVTLDVRPGAPLDDQELASGLGVGRTPVREALKRLESERLVAVYPRRGTFATEVNLTDLGHISEVRQQLEPLAATTATRRCTPDDRAALRALLDELDAQSPRDGAARNATQLMHLDMRVHRTLYAATHNPFLEDTLAHYDNLATRIWCLVADRLSDLAGHVDEHRPLLQAVLDGDTAKAGELAADHVARFEQAVRAVL